MKVGDGEDAADVVDPLTALVAINPRGKRFTFIARKQ